MRVSSSEIFAVVAVTSREGASHPQCIL
jgi:hypothetical protein